MKLMTAKYEKGDIVITIPAALIRFAAKNKPDFPLKILKKNEDVMGEYVAKNVVWFDEDQDTGISRFTQLLDDLLVEAYENAEAWIEEIEETR